MFRIPSFYKMDLTFDRAAQLLSGSGTLLENMERMDALWNTHCESFDDDDAFYETWQWEVNAYNVVYAGMAPLFAEKN